MFIKTSGTYIGTLSTERSERSLGNGVLPPVSIKMALPETLKTKIVTAKVTCFVSKP